MKDFPSNSNESKKPKKSKKHDDDIPDTKPKVERVVEGKVVRRKQPISRRIRNFLIGSDDPASVWQTVVQSVVIPATRDLITDTLVEGVLRTFQGDPRGRSEYTRYDRPDRRGSTRHVSYDRYSETRRRESPRDVTRVSRARNNFDDIIFETREEANEVLERLYDLLSTYEQVSIAEFYELSGLSSDFSDDRFGWFSLRGSSVHRTRAGYLLNLPRPEELD